MYTFLVNLFRKLLGLKTETFEPEESSPQEDQRIRVDVEGLRSQISREQALTEAKELWNYFHTEIIPIITKDPSVAWFWDIDDDAMERLLYDNPCLEGAARKKYTRLNALGVAFGFTAEDVGVDNSELMWVQRLGVLRSSEYQNDSVWLPEVSAIFLNS